MDKAIKWVGIFMLTSMMVLGIAVVGLGAWGIYLDLVMHHIPSFLTYNAMLIVLGCVVLAIPITVWKSGDKK